MISSISNPAMSLLRSATAEALHCLGRTPLEDQVVHTARKALKRARAALRLLRPVIAEEKYRAANLALRNAGRHLSPLRDARILLDALDCLAESIEDAKTLGAIADLKKLMRARLSKAHRAMLDPDARRHCSDLIKAGRLRLRGKMLHPDPAALLPGLQQIYRNARKAFLQARATKTPEDLHEWRKQVKYLRTAAAVLRTSKNSRLRRAEKSADDIAAWLGDDHDLAVLDELTREHESPIAAKRLTGLIGTRRTKLQHKAISAGEKLFARTPERFLRDVS